jgi:entry exclusion lipoprotein TrbK
MIRRSCTLLLLAIVGAALLAGCGSSSQSSGGTATLTSNSTVPTGDTGKKATPAQEVVTCERTVERIRTLPASTRAQLKSSCGRIGTGEAGKRQVAHEVCYQLALRLTSPIARARAQKICSAP